MLTPNIVSDMFMLVEWWCRWSPESSFSIFLYSLTEFSQFPYFFQSVDITTVVWLLCGTICQGNVRFDWNKRLVSHAGKCSVKTANRHMPIIDITASPIWATSCRSHCQNHSLSRNAFSFILISKRFLLWGIIGNQSALHIYNVCLILMAHFLFNSAYLLFYFLSITHCFVVN